MTSATMNVSLPSAMKEFVDNQMKTGGYGSTSEYVRELIRNDQIAKAEAQLRAMLLEGLNSGPAVMVDANYFTELKARVKARHAKV
jgi:antitoxin ParD1/3/4